jgi:hypothetical protein
MCKSFSKKINISNDYAAGEIRPRFINGILSLSMPKKVPLLKKLQQLGGKGSPLQMKVGIEAALKIIIAVTVGVAFGYYLAHKHSEFSRAEN